MVMKRHVKTMQRSVKNRGYKMNIWKYILLMTGLISFVNGQDVMPKELEAKAAKVLNLFMKTVQENSFEKSAKMVVPLMHKSLLDRGQKVLDRDTYRFSFKKAHTNAKHYTYPVNVTRVQKLRTTEIGHPSVGTHEKGVEYKIWIDKKPSIRGLPAPLVIFFNEGSMDAKLSYVGSL